MGRKYSDENQGVRRCARVWHAEEVFRTEEADGYATQGKRHASICSLEQRLPKDMSSAKHAQMQE